MNRETKHTPKGIMGRSTKNNDPGMTWVRIHTEDYNFYSSADQLKQENEALRAACESAISIAELHGIVLLKAKQALQHSKEGGR